MTAIFNFNFSFTPWDFLLMVAVALMGTAVAYLPYPRWKAFILALPIPFTIANLSLARGVNTTHVVGISFTLLYTHFVRLLHVRWRLPIIYAIATSVVGYLALGFVMAKIVPSQEPPLMFWAALCILGAILFVSIRFTPHRDEPEHRTLLPVWIKLPVILGIVALLVVSKKMLLGFMTTAPMVNILASYEARHSLWTICRGFSLFTLCFIPMLAVAHVAAPHIGLGGALALGWLVYLGVIMPTLWLTWWKAGRRQAGKR